MNPAEWLRALTRITLTCKLQFGGKYWRLDTLDDPVVYATLSDNLNPIAI
jgi:hypothetical protein